MIHSLLALAAVAVTPQRTTTPQLSVPGTIAYGTENQIANPGFETSPVADAWNVPYAVGDWDGEPAEEGEFDDAFPIASGRTTETRHSGAASFCFDLNYESNGNMPLYDSAVAQTLKTPTKVGDIAAASLWAWSSDEWAPGWLRIDVFYTDGSSTVQSQYIPAAQATDETALGRGFRKIDFKASLSAGKTVTGIMLSTSQYGKYHPGLFIDDVTIGKKVPLVVKP